jgi:hypothetical protein
MKVILNEDETFGFPSGSVDTGKVVRGGSGGNWGGSMGRALEIASFAKKCSGKKNPISSQKRSRRKTASGGVSDHFEGNLDAYAVDLPTAGKEGDKLLACIMGKFEGGAYSSYKGGKWLNINVEGYRYQFGWRVKGHYDHIHVGVKKISGSKSSTRTDKVSVKNISYDNFSSDEKSLIKKTMILLNNEGVNNVYSKIGLASMVVYGNQLKNTRTKGTKVGTPIEQVVKNLISDVEGRNFKSIDEVLTFLDNKTDSKDFNKSEIKKIANKFTLKIKTSPKKEVTGTIDKVINYFKDFTSKLFNEEDNKINEDVDRMKDIMKKII